MLTPIGVPTAVLCMIAAIEIRGYLQGTRQLLPASETLFEQK
jgi:hypothetical protein